MGIEEDILLIGGAEELIGSVILMLQTETTLLELDTKEGELRRIGGSCLPLPTEAGRVSNTGLWN